MVSLKFEMFKMVTYLGVPLITYYMINSPKLNLFHQRETMKKHELQRHIDVQRVENETEISENIKEFRKWKQQNQ